MRLSDLKDFVTFAKYMNVTRAASELHMTQSNLSKRIRAIEDEVGCPLVAHAEGSIGLTASGLLFLDKITSFLAEYDEILDEVRAVSASEMDALVVWTPTWPDLAAAKTVALVGRLKERCPNAAVQFVRRQYQTPLEMIDQGAVDAHIMYEFGNEADIARRYEGLGYLAVPLCADQLAVYCDRAHPLAASERLRVEDLRDVGIMQITQLYRPLEKAIIGMCAACGFRPVLVDRTMNSFEEMLTVRDRFAVHVFPYSVKDDIQIKSCVDSKLIPVESGEPLRAFLVMRRSPGKKLARMLQSELLAEG